MENNITQDTNNLPMIVWLRGDEEEFTLTAEDVMATLDIKRSRLTQISGRELRVGRRRVDRYLKPFYRPADVHSYQEQTRAALTRQRSAAAVSSVAADIEARHKNQLQTTTTQMITTINNTNHKLQKILNTLTLETQTKTYLTITEQNFLQTQKLLPCFTNLARQLHTLLTEFKQHTTISQNNTQQLLDALHTQHKQYQQTLAQLLDKIETQHEEFSHSDKTHTAQLLALQQNNTELKQQLQTITIQQEQKWQTLHSLLDTETNKLTQLLANSLLPELAQLRTAPTRPLPPPPRVWASVWL